MVDLSRLATLGVDLSRYIVDGDQRVALDDALSRFRGGALPGGTMTTETFLVLAPGAESAVLTGTRGGVLWGNDLANYLVGNAGGNGLIGGNGDDVLFGGAGNDSLFGDAGFDTAVYTGRFAEYAISVSFNTTRVTSAAEGSDTLGGVERLLFADGRADLIGGSWRFTPTPVPTPPPPTNLVQSGQPIVLTDAQVDALLTGDASASITGNDRANGLTGNGASNRLDGRGGDDTLRGLGGDDLLDGGVGRDTARYDGAASRYEIVRLDAERVLVRDREGRDGTDLLRGVELAAFADRSVELSGVAVRTGASASVTGAFLLEVSRAFGFNSYLSSLSLDYSLPRAMALADLRGTATFRGSNGTDILFGGTGANQLFGNGGNDVLVGGGGDDLLDGGDGTDTVAVIGTRADYAVVREGDDVLLAALRTDDGVDRLRNVEKIRFADGTVDVAQLLAGSGTSSGPSAPAAAPPPAAAAPPPPQPPATPTITLGTATLREDSAGALPLTIGVPGGATLQAVRISGLPQGATLTDGTGRVLQGGQAIDLSGAQAQNLRVTPPANRDGSFALTVEATVVNAAGLTATATANGTLAITGVADAPTLSADLGAPVRLGTGQIEAPLSIRTGLTDTDGSESLSLSVSGLPAGARLSAGTAQPDGSWSLTPDQLANLKLVLPATVAGDVRLQVTATAREDGSGDVARVTDDVSVTVPSFRSVLDVGGGAGRSSGAQVAAGLHTLDLALKNNSGAPLGSEHVTFGQSFVAGDLKAGQGLVAVINGQEVPVQLDVKTTHDDGSVRHAVLTLKAPALATGQGVDLALKATAAPAGGAPVTAQAAFSKGWDFAVRVDIDGVGTRTVDVDQLLRDSLASGRADVWLQGPQVTEYRVEQQLNEHLLARFDVRVHADGTVRTDVQITNDTAFTKGIKTYTYDLTATENGRQVLSVQDVRHYPRTNWHEVVWGNGADARQAQVIHDTDYLADAGVLPNYDEGAKLDGWKIDQLVGQVLADSGPMGAGGITKHMGQTGHRADIGVSTGFTTAFISRQDAGTLEMIKAQADATGSIPWHVRNEATGTALDPVQYRNTWYDWRWEKKTLAENFDTGDRNGWQMDTAHQPQTVTIVYAITGDRYYKDALTHQAIYNLFWDNPAYVQDGRWAGQLRSVAWTLRTISDFAYLAPDNDPLRASVEQRLGEIMNRFIRDHVLNGVMDAAGELEGWLGEHKGFWGTEYGSRDAMAPWQQDYLMSVLGMMDRRGEAGARTFMAWMENFSAGRFLMEDQGLDPGLGAVYNAMTKLPDMTALSTWEDYAALMAKYGIVAPEGGFRDMDYSDEAWGAMSSLLTSTGSAMAAEALGVIVERGHDWLMDSIRRDQHGLIMPRFADGTELTWQNVVRGSNGGETLRAPADGPALLQGLGGDDTVQGGRFTDLLFGGAGNDRLVGLDGDDFLFGGLGDDRLEGGAGSDWLEGGKGRDVFVLDGRGHDVLADFKPGEDRLEIGLSLAQLTAKVELFEDGLRLGLGTDASLTLLGVRLDDLPSLLG